MMEIWKEVVGYEGLYEVSSLGRVKSVGRLFMAIRHGSQTKITIRERILKQQFDVYGYKIVKLSANDSGKNIKVHRILAMAFLPNPENKPSVNHLNGIKSDNRVENLEWCTCAENNQHAVDFRLIVRAKGRECKKSIPISQFTLSGVWLKDWWGARCVEQETGIHGSRISKCINGKRNSAGGFIWRKAIAQS
jgi:hypothetical protein